MLTRMLSFFRLNAPQGQICRGCEVVIRVAERRVVERLPLPPSCRLTLAGCVLNKPKTPEYLHVHSALRTFEGGPKEL